MLSRSEESVCPEREAVCKELSGGLSSHCSCVTLNAHERISHSLRCFAALRMTGEIGALQKNSQ